MGDRRARLIDDGWTRSCGTCRGRGILGDCIERGCPPGVSHAHTAMFCPDCVEGCLPPDGIVEAATEAAHRTAYVDRPVIKGDDVWESWKAITQSVLVEAERWAAKQ